MKKKLVGVLGLGIFGRAVARQLSQFDQDVIAVDMKENIVNEFGNIVTKAVLGDITDKNFLLAVGLDHCETVVVATGNNLESSVLAILNCKKIGIPIIIAKAKNKIYEEVLYGIGATNVISPERDSGKHVASNILKHHIENIIYLENHVSIINFKIPESWVGKNLAELSIRQKYELNIIGTRLHKGGHLKLNVDPNTPLPPNIILVGIANDRTFEKFDYLGYLK
ncbi:MAG: potassium uptake transporter gating subunit KtrA [Lactococcus raffinolactis]